MGARRPVIPSLPRDLISINTTTALTKNRRAEPEIFVNKAAEPPPMDLMRGLL